MRRHLIVLAALLSLFSPSAQAANSTVSAMTAASALGGTELLYCVQAAADRKCTPVQLATYIFGLVSGDLTCAAGGACTLKNTGPGATGPLGSATVAPIVTIDAQGRVTALTSATVTPAVGSVTGLGTGVAAFLATPSSANLAAALTDETGTGAAVFGTAPTISSPTINTAATFGFITGSTQCLHVNTSGVLSGTGSDCGSGAGAVSSVTGGQGVTVSPTTGAVVVSSAATQRNNTLTTDTITNTDRGTVITESNGSAVAVAITTAGFVTTDYITVKNLGNGPATYTASAGNIDGGTLVCAKNQSSDLYFDGTNWHQLGSTCGLGALATVTPGTGVATAAAVALSGAGGLTSTILPNGTAVLGTSAIAPGACATVVTTAATNVLTTDVVYYGFNSDPTAVTGYGASATGAVLSIYPYPTAGQLNVKVCNSTASSITPGAMTLNLNVHR